MVARAYRSSASIGCGALAQDAVARSGPEWSRSEYLISSEKQGKCHATMSSRQERMESSSSVFSCNAVQILVPGQIHGKQIRALIPFRHMKSSYNAGCVGPGDSPWALSRVLGLICLSAFLPCERRIVHVRKKDLSWASPGVVAVAGCTAVVLYLSLASTGKHPEI
jgi:hypothetical protein